MVGNVAEALMERASKILEANRIDLDAAESNGLTDAQKDRLRLTEERIARSPKGSDKSLHCQIR